MALVITQAPRPKRFWRPIASASRLSPCRRIRWMTILLNTCEEDEKTGNPQQVLQGVCRDDGVSRASAGVFCHASRHGVRLVWALLRRKRLGTQTGRLDSQKQT